MAGDLIIGDVLAELAKLPADHFDCVVTSPPYWGLRDYGAEGQIGLEPTMAEHLDKMVAVCAEIWRVLKPTGTFWLNYGDCYASKGGAGGTMSASGLVGNADMPRPEALDPEKFGRWNKDWGPCKSKDLCMIPNRLAIRLQEWGWWIRSEIVWAKPNPMPESVTDRPATAHEKIWLLTKAARYHYDNEAVRVQRNGNTHSRGTKRSPPIDDAGIGHASWVQYMTKDDELTDRNLRNYEPAPVQVWEMATRPFPGAHFATFPPELVERCLLAGTSQKGCCAGCGAPWVRDLEIGERIGKSRGGNYGGIPRNDGTKVMMGDYQAGAPFKKVTLGWSPSCQCKAWTCPKCPTVLNSQDGKREQERSAATDIPSGLCPMQSELHGVEADKQMVRPEVPSALGSEEPQHDQGMDDNIQGLQDASQAGSSERNVLRLRDGTPASDGERARPASHISGDRSPSERRQTGQSTGESGSHGEAEARCLPEAGLPRDVPELPSNVPSSRQCARCGSELQRTTPPSVPARVLDSFGGAGTVGLVADAMGLDWTLIELNPEYAAMAEARIKARVAKDGGPRTPRCDGTTDMFEEMV